MEQLRDRPSGLEVNVRGARTGGAFSGEWYTARLYGQSVPDMRMCGAGTEGAACSGGD